MKALFFIWAGVTFILLGVVIYRDIVPQEHLIEKIYYPKENLMCLLYRKTSISCVRLEVVAQ